METELTHLSLDELKVMLAGAELQLQASLLDGAQWKDVKTQVDLITDINIAIYRLKYSSAGCPAEVAIRNS